MKNILLTLALVLLAATAGFGQAIATPGVRLDSCVAVTTTGACTAYAAPLTQYTLPSSVSWQVYFDTGSAATLAVNLEGSILDPASAYCVANSTVCWQQFDQTVALGGEFRSVVNRTFKWVRCRVVTYTLGTTNTLSCSVQIKGS